MRLISAHISQWDVNFAGKWDSALKGNTALRARVASAAGIELAYRGSICNPLLLGHAKIQRQHQGALACSTARDCWVPD